MSYSDKQFTITLTVTASGGGEKGAEKAVKMEWDKHCRKFDLKPEQFGKTFTFRGEEFKVTGIKRYAEKFPILGTKNGKTFGFRADVLD